MVLCRSPLTSYFLDGIYSMLGVWGGVQRNTVKVWYTDEGAWPWGTQTQTHTLM
jgi:hypothetical protein